ncbi:FAD binding domain-containing protein [Hymenobacter sp. BT175]|uniref:FAD binding domain-containing protein n=1 Tax=Hymenobacter translucens TaxID=2886507 RepID=UPI001D0E67FA|nr:FAD binding domain-containing protein [Hymenobacter translucens]MCC2545102.1 FAD binding domain-containing protein [Hymenobacter translucens]
MIQFILNNREVSTDLPAGALLLDYIRYDQRLTGTKIGCREGDCGACTVLIGEPQQDQLRYRSFTSCLTPLANVQGKHVVTIEGINQEGLNPIQQAMVDESATQCGFCTPGFVMSLAGLCLSHHAPTPQHALAAIDGNICRCTGYKSIERAALRVAGLLADRQDTDPAEFVAQQQILPEYFAGIKARLQNLPAPNGHSNGQAAAQAIQTVGGGTDLYVQKHAEMVESANRFLLNNTGLKGITLEGTRCVIGGAATVTDMAESDVFKSHFPAFRPFLKLVSSTPIRNMATVAGNFVNASPIGDLTIIFLALDATLTLNDGVSSRTLPLRQLYQGYKTLAKTADETIARISFELPAPATRFNFEKVSKRTHLDIASVNSACVLAADGHVVTAASFSAGGVGPVPMYLPKTSAFVVGKPLTEALIQQAVAVAQTEISPISDARGTETYKRLLLGQLLKGHFLALFPHLNALELVS